MSNAGFEYGRSDFSFGGGGFGGGLDPMSGTAGGPLADAGNRSAEKKGSRERQSLTPVTIKQLLSCEYVDEVFKVDGAELAIVKIIAIIDTVTQHATNHTYFMSDSTGSIECKQWVEKDTEKSAKQEGCRQNALVRVCGTLREYEGKRHVLIYDMAPVEDWNELTHHLLDAILVHLKRTRGPIPGSASAASMSMGMRPGMAMSPAGFPGRVAVQAVASGSHRLHDAILDVFRTYPSQEGLDCDKALTILRSSIPALNMNELRKAVTELSNDGLLYTTVDDDHFKSTDS